MTLRQIRHAFGRLPNEFHKQIGLRYVQEALWLEGRNAARVAELHNRAAQHLELAREIHAVRRRVFSL